MRDSRKERACREEVEYKEEEEVIAGFRKAKRRESLL